jgi:hypothetical protein
MTEQEYLLQQIDLIRLEYEKAVKPYVDRLVYLKSLEPLPPIFVTFEQAAAIAKATGAAE